MPEISEFFRVTTQLSTGGLARRRFGVGLLLTTDSRIAAGGSAKAQLFRDADAVREVISSGEALRAAQVWFAQSPGPQPLYIGRWATTNIATRLQGGTPAALSDLRVASAGFAINGQDVTADLSASSIMSYAAIAGALQTALQALGGIFAGATVTYDSATNFTIMLAGAQPITGGAVTAPGTGVDISAGLGLAAGTTGLVYQQGHDMETAVQAVDEISGIAANAPTYVMRDGSTPDTLNSVDTDLSLAAWADTVDAMVGIRDATAGALVTGETTSKLAMLFSRQYRNVLAVAAATGEYPDIGALSQLSAIDFTGRRTMITLQGKAISGVLPLNVTDTQFAEIQRKRANIYTTIAGLPTFTEGFAPRAGHWSDAVVFLLWLKGALERAAWGAMRSARRLTVEAYAAALNQVMERAVQVGGLQARRQVNNVTADDIRQTTGNVNFNGILPLGYLVYVGRPVVQDEEENETDPMSLSGQGGDSETRRAPPAKIWGAGSDAIHGGNIDFIFQN